MIEIDPASAAMLRTRHRRVPQRCGSAQGVCTRTAMDQAMSKNATVSRRDLVSATWGNSVIIIVSATCRCLERLHSPNRVVLTSNFLISRLHCRAAWMQPLTNSQPNSINLAKSEHRESGRPPITKNKEPWSRGAANVHSSPPVSPHRATNVAELLRIVDDPRPPVLAV